MADTRQDVISLSDLLEWGDSALYEYRERVLPDVIINSTKANARLFFNSHRKHTYPALPAHVQAGTYRRLSEINENNASVSFLDHEATKALFAGFPGYSHYVLIRLIPRTSWIFMLPGLVRRLLLGQITIQGILKLKAGASSQRWLIVKHKWARSLDSYSYLSSEIGVQGFLDYLRKEKVRYVVLRFFEALPNLHREGADLDILLANEDRDKVDAFLWQNSGPIRIELKTVSSLRSNKIPYFPPHLARTILDSAMEGPAGSFVPAPREAFLSLAYHALYHKGARAGIPSRLPHIPVNEFSESNYTEMLGRMAEKLGVDIPITMEDIDEYLQTNGWRPKTDTLAKIAVENKWVLERFFNKEAPDIGLGVFVLKERAFELNVSDAIIESILEHKDFIVIRKRLFSKEDKKRVTDHLRGGVWADASGSTNGLLPAMALVVLDLHRARASVANTTHGRRGIRKLKESLRTRFDSGDESIIHSTDSTEEAWEYITVCFPEDVSAIRKETDSFFENLHISTIGHIALRLRTIPHWLARFVMVLRARIIRYLM